MGAAELQRNDARGKLMTTWRSLELDLDRAAAPAWRPAQEVSLARSDGPGCRDRRARRLGSLVLLDRADYVVVGRGLGVGAQVVDVDVVGGEIVEQRGEVGA